ncbi:hypothetical protein CFOL_v3_21730, partial [Cephalotus follicularis]
TISIVHPDIIQTPILTRLDGPTLAAAACATSQLHALSIQEKLWQDICSSTWPSVNDPRVRHVISTFPSGYRSFFSDSFPALDDQQQRQLPSIHPASKLISAVDIYYQDRLIFSKVEETETVNSWFMCSPFRVDLLDPKESVSVSTPVQQTPIHQFNDDTETLLNNIEDNMTLSWILIDPTQKRAVNLSSRRPVSVERHWLTGEVQVHFATIMAGDGRWGSSEEYVECGVVVTCGVKEGGGGMHLSEVSLQVEDMEGKSLNGRDSLVILGGAMESGKRRKEKERNEGKERFEEFMDRKMERKERMVKRERVLDMVCVSIGIVSFVTFWSVVLFR